MLKLAIFVIAFLVASTAAAREKIVITAEGYGAIPNVRTEEVASLNVLAINKAIADVMAAGGGTVIIPAQTFAINAPIGISAQRDTSANVAIVGEGGRRAAQLLQVDRARAVVELKTARGNLRGIKISDLTVYGGRYGFDLAKVEYSLFENVVFRAQMEWGVHSTKGGLTSQFRRCWFVNQTVASNNVYVSDGTLMFVDSVFGEAAGGFMIRHGRLLLDNPLIHGGSFKGPLASPHQDAGNSLFQVVDGGSLNIQGGRVNPGRAVTLIYADRPQEILIEGATFRLNRTANFIAIDRAAYKGSTHALVVRSGLLRSKNAAGLNLYRALSSTQAAHRQAIYDVVVSYPRRAPAPRVDTVYSAAECNNTLHLRALPR